MRGENEAIVGALSGIGGWDGWGGGARNVLVSSDWGMGDGEGADGLGSDGLFGARSGMGVVDFKSFSLHSVLAPLLPTATSSVAVEDFRSQPTAAKKRAQFDA